MPNSLAKLKLLIEPSFRAGFLTPRARLVFTKLRQVFIETLILYYFDLKYYIQIETNVLDYTIDEAFSQLTLDNLGWWYPFAFFSRKIILVKTQYKTYINKLLAIVEAFKTQRHNLESCKHEFFISTNYNNLYNFIDIKNLSSKKVHCTQKLFQYHFQIEYSQSKANEATDVFSRYPQQNAKNVMTWSLDLVT